MAASSTATDSAAAAEAGDAAAGENQTAAARGRFVFDDGAVYEGEYVEKDGLTARQGRGVFTDGVETYEGEWESDVMHGEGTYTAASGAKYRGGFVRGAYEGQGAYEWPDGAQYTGAWRAGLFHGEGVYRSAAGVTWRGTFYRGRYSTGKAYVDVRKAET